jgi:hypothetical protein
MSQLGLVPRTARTRARGEGVCTVTVGKNKGRVRSCTKGKGGVWRSRKPLSKLSPAGRKRRRAAAAAPAGAKKKRATTGCRKERVSYYGNVRCMKVCRKKGRVVSREAASGCRKGPVRSRVGGTKGAKSTRGRRR